MKALSCTTTERYLLQKFYLEFSGLACFCPEFQIRNEIGRESKIPEEKNSRHSIIKKHLKDIQHQLLSTVETKIARAWKYVGSWQLSKCSKRGMSITRQDNKSAKALELSSQAQWRLSNKH